MKRGECGTVVSREDLSEHDRREVELFEDYIRRRSERRKTETAAQSYAHIYGEIVFVGETKKP